MAAHRPDPAIDGPAAEIVRRTPDFEATTSDGANHRIWAVTEGEGFEALAAGFAGARVLYIADGHHRAAAAARIARTRGTAATGRFLTVSFPADQMRILGYNRVVRDLAGHTPETFLAAAAERFAVEPAAAAAVPRTAGEFGLYVDHCWYRLRPKPPVAPGDSAVARLDVSVLTEALLRPVLDIGDPRTDPRIDFVGGARGPGALEAKVNDGEMAAAFALYPTAMADLLAVADAGEVMPPKSTWFEPKLADGLLALPLDD